MTETLVSKKINEALNEVLNWINILHTYGSQYVDILVDIRTNLYQEEQALQVLLQGYLPYLLVPPHELTHTLQDISDILPTLGSFQISHREIGYYYHLNDVTYQRVDDNFYVKIKIPLTTTTTLFTLYRMNAVPIPLGADRKERSIVEMSKPYIAISHDNLFYIMLSESEYHFCTGNQLKRCNQALSMQETTHPDCALALFNDQPKLVSKLCQINLLLANTTATHIITVSDNPYLISSEDTHWIQTCPGRTPMHVTPCRLCIVNLPCACALKGQTFFIPPTLHNCLPNSTPVVTHMVNLPALFHFYKDQSNLLNITSKTFFPKPVKPRIPEISIVNKEYDDVIQQSTKRLSLAKIARNVKAKKTIYIDKVSKLESDLGILSKPEIGTGISIVSCLTCVISVLALIMSINVYCKMLVLAHVATAIDWTPNVTEEPKEILVTSVFHEYMSLMILLIIFCAVITFAALFLRFWARSTQLFTQKFPHTSISLILFGNGDCFSVPLLTTSLPIRMINLSLVGDVQSFPTPRITCAFSHVYLAWHDIFLASDTGHVINLPIKVPINLLKRSKLRRIITNLSEIQLIASTLDEYAQLHTWFIKPENETCSKISFEPIDANISPDALPQEQLHEN